MANQYTFVNGRRRNQTLITFDNGASWNGITAPVGSSSNCTQVRLFCYCIMLPVDMFTTEIKNCVNFIDKSLKYVRIKLFIIILYVLVPDINAYSKLCSTYVAI